LKISLSRSGYDNPENIVKRAVEQGREDPQILNAEVIRDISWTRNDILSYFVQGTNDNWTAYDYLSNENVWSEEFHEYFGGRCHTWKPTKPTKPGETNALMLGLKNIGNYLFNRCGFCHLKPV